MQSVVEVVLVVTVVELVLIGGAVVVLLMAVEVVVLIVEVVVGVDPQSGGVGSTLARHASRRSERPAKQALRHSLPCFRGAQACLHAL